MKLEECLGKLPPENLEQLAKQWQLTTSKSHERLARHIARHLLGERALDVMSGMDEDYRLALKLIVLCREGRGLVVEQCHQKLNQITRKWRRNGARVVNNLMEHGLVYTERVNYRQVYYVPGDLREALAGAFAAGILGSISGDCPHECGDQPDPLLPLRLLCMFLSYVGKSTVRLTQSGSIFRRSQRDVLEYLGMNENVPEEEQLFVPNYPPTLALLYYYCRSRSLVCEGNGRLVHAAPLPQWLARPPADRLRDFYGFWQEAYLKQDADLETMYGLLRLVPDGKYASVNGLLKEMQGLAVAQSWQGLGSRVRRHLLEPLRLMGLLQVAGPDGDLWCRLSPAARREPEWDGAWTLEDRFFVQPNFDVLVPKNIEPGLLWQVESVADLVKPDQLMLYRISKQSVYRALNNGMSKTQLMDFLSQHSRNPLSQNIVSTLEEWCQAYGRMRFLDVLILQCDDVAMAEELKASRRIAGFIQGELTPRDLIVKRESYHELLTALSEAGYMPRTQPLDPSRL
ncbi:MAG: helicase-associated domain-containing protein [Bacillota bacterium]